jgi:hypothetical protein
MREKGMGYVRVGVISNEIYKRTKKRKKKEDNKTQHSHNSKRCDDLIFAAELDLPLLPPLDGGVAVFFPPPFTLCPMLWAEAADLDDICGDTKLRIKLASVISSTSRWCNVWPLIMLMGSQFALVGGFLACGCDDVAAAAAEAEAAVVVTLWAVRIRFGELALRVDMGILFELEVLSVLRKEE